MVESSGTAGEKRPPLPPNWFIRFAWAVHRAIARWTGGRRGLWNATPEKWGTFRLRTVGRKSGKERIAILGYMPDGPNVVTVAMNGWMEGHPAWWLNLQANPDTTIELNGRTMAVRARAATPEEAPRLWNLFPEALKFVPHRKTETPVVILEPRPED